MIDIWRNLIVNSKKIILNSIELKNVPLTCRELSRGSPLRSCFANRSVFPTRSRTSLHYNMSTLSPALTNRWDFCISAVSCRVFGAIVLVGLSFSALLPKCKYDIWQQSERDWFMENITTAVPPPSPQFGNYRIEIRLRRGDHTAACTP